MNTKLSKLNLDDIKQDIHRLVEATAGVADETVVSARKRLSGALKKATQGAESAGKYVMDHRREVTVIGTVALVAGAAGFVVGMMLSQKSE